MPERQRLAVLLGCWCALRYGEMAELGRSEIDFDRGVITVRRGLTGVGDGVWWRGSAIAREHAEDNMLVGRLSQRGRSADVSEASYSNPGLRGRCVQASPPTLILAMQVAADQA